MLVSIHCLSLIRLLYRTSFTSPDEGGVMPVCMRQRLISLNSDRDWVPTSYTYDDLRPKDQWEPDTRIYWMREDSFNALVEYSSNSEYGHNDWHGFTHFKRVAIPTNVLVNDFSERTVRDRTFGQFGYYIGTPSRTVDMFNCAQFGTASDPTVGMPAMFSISSEGELVISPPDDLDSLLGYAFRRMLPGIKPDLSLVNSIIELKDFVTLKETFSHLDSILDRLSALNNLRREAFAGLSFREILRRRSSDYLQLKFNLIPLYSDIKGILNTFKRYQAQVMRLLAQAERLNTRHVAFNIGEYVGDPVFETSDRHAPETEFSPPGIQYQLTRTTISHRKVTFEPSKFHLEMEFQYNFSKVQTEHARFFAIMDGLGVNLNPAIIWNAIPWSFVVDWVLGVSQYLNQFSTRNLEPVVNIRRCLWSIKRSRNIECSFDLVDGPAANPASTVLETAYRRQLCMPSQASLRASGLSLSEVSLGAALVFSRRPRH